MAVAAILLAVSIVAVPARGAVPSSCQWPMYGHDPARSGTSSCPSAPTPTTVSRLLPRWVVRAADVVTATPSVVDGVAYIGDWYGKFYAIDVATGSLHWSTTLGLHQAGADADRHHGAYGVITGSAAVATIGGAQVVFVPAGDSMYALAAPTGRVLWRTDLDPAHPTNSGEIESSPVVWTGAPGGPIVIFGSDANQDSGYTGEGMWALRAATGRPVWHFSPEAAAGKALYGCGNVWSSPALGVDGGTPAVYFGTADCPNNGGTACPSDGRDPRCPVGTHYDYSKRWERFSEATIAISAIDGSPLWSYQSHKPLNTDDDDFGASAQLFTLPGGRRVVGEGNKDGTYTVVDRATGKLIWKQVEQGNGNVRSGLAIGGFLGATAVMDVHGVPRVFGASAIDTPVTYTPASGGLTLQPGSVLQRSLMPMRAFSAVDGSPSWAALQLYSYAPTTAANGVVYSGSLDGFVRAYDAATGAVLWAFPVGAPVSSGAAIAGNTIVVGTGTSETDLQFKVCDRLPSPLGAACKHSPLEGTVINPLSYLNGIWAFSTSSR